MHDVTLATVLSTSVIWRGNDSLSGWVESKVSLIHQLLIETRIDIRIVVCDGLVILMIATLVVDLRPILEELVQD